MSNKPELSLEEKIDKILAYQKSARRWALIRALVLLVIIVAPVFALPYILEIVMSKLPDIVSSTVGSQLQGPLGTGLDLEQLMKLLSK